MTTNKNARRSWLIVAADQVDVMTYVEPLGADVVVLDLEYTVPPKNKGGKVQKMGSIAIMPAWATHRQARAT